MGANMVKEAVPVLSTHSCLKRLVGRLERMGAGSMRFTAWSTPQHKPAWQCCAPHLEPTTEGGEVAGLGRGGVHYDEPAW